MLKKFFIIPLLVLMAACTSFDAETPEQKLYAAITDYTTVQKTAVEYKKSCKAGLLNGVNCVEHVETMQLINTKANLLIQAIDTKTLSDDYTVSVTQALLVITNELTQYLVKAQDRRTVQ